MAIRPKNIKVTKDNVTAMVAGVKDLTTMRVLVGVPATAASRQARKGEHINNAALAYIHNYGSPARNIPARPFMEPGIRNAREAISKHMRAAATYAMKGQREHVLQEFYAVGLAAQSAIRMKITTGPFAPLKPGTIRNRLREHPGRKGEKAALAALAALSAGKPYPVGSVMPLMDTGQLRASISFIVRQKGG